MVETKLIDGFKVWSRDIEVRRLIKKYERENPHGGGGNTMRMAIQNDAYQVYRVIETVGMGTMMHFTNGLSGLGMEDLLIDKAGMTDGYDCIFQPNGSGRKFLG